MVVQLRSEASPVTVSDNVKKALDKIYKILDNFQYKKVLS